jgi:hypothetical protein
VAIDRAEIGEWEEYVPNVEGQQELYIDEPDQAVTVEIKMLSKADRDKYERAMVRSKKRGGITDADTKLVQRMFENHVRNVRNYSVGGRPITTGLALYETDDLDIINDLALAIAKRSYLEKGLTKKLKSRCVSPSSPRPNRKNGGAPGVTPTSTQTTQETEQAKIRRCEEPMRTNVEPVTVTAKATPVYDSAGPQGSNGAQGHN